MASTNKTTNYNLSQFEGTDKPSWEADYNADMLTIDTNLKAVSDVADGASGSLSTLADRVTTAEGNISTNANDIDALEARADVLEAGQTSDDSRLDALEAEQIVQNTAIESNTRLGYNLARPYDSASTYAIGAYVLFQDTLYKCITAVSTGEAFDPSKWLAIKATDEISGAGNMTHIRKSSSHISDYFTINEVLISGNANTGATATPVLFDYFSIGNTRIIMIQGFVTNMPAMTSINLMDIDLYCSATNLFELPTFSDTYDYTPCITTGHQALTTQQNEHTLFNGFSTYEGLMMSQRQGSNLRLRFACLSEVSTLTTRRYDFKFWTVYNV